MKQIVTDLTINYEEMQRSPKKAGLNPERAKDFDRKFELLNEAMQQNMQLTQQYKALKDNMAKEQSAKERERQALQQQLKQERV